MKKKIFFIFVMIISLFILPGCKTKLEKQQYEIYKLAQEEGYEGTFDEWVESIKGADGKDGREIEVPIEKEKIVWRYIGDTEWKEIYSVNDLIGPKGEDGISIIKIEKTSTEGLIDVYTITYSNHTTTTFTVTNGKPGEQGIKGEPGVDGHTPIITISDKFTWVIDGVDTKIFVKGENGKDGEDGKSAYEIYKEKHPEYTKSEDEWLDDLVNGRLGTIEDTYYTVKFDTGIEEIVIEDQKVLENKKIKKPQDPIREGYEFLGWYIDNEKWIFNGYSVSDDIILTAKWSRNQYNVIINYNNGQPNFNKRIYYDDVVNIELPTKKDYDLLGFIDDKGNKVEFPYVVKNDVTITAVWDLLKFNINYELNGGTNNINNPNVYKKNETLNILDPTKYDSIFKGWYLDKDFKVKFENQTQLSGNITLYAKWEYKQFNINYVLNGGINNDNNPNYYLCNHNKIYLEEPTKQSYRFMGWFLNNQKIDYLTSDYFSDITLEAKWKPESCNITYVLNGGINNPNNPSKVCLDELPLILENPTYEGKIFSGWSLNGVKINSIDDYDSTDIILIANWHEPLLIVGKDNYKSINEALNNASDGCTIQIGAGSYLEDIEINIPNLTIVGPNEGINPNTQSRTTEAILLGKILIKSSAYNLKIDGVSFTDNAQIIANDSSEYSGFNFINNKVYKTTTEAKPWAIDRYQMNAFLEFKLPDGGASNNFNIQNNRFEEIKMVNVMINRANNLSIDNNVFLDFGVDAFRCEGGYNKGVLSFTNNFFEQTKRNNGYNAMFLYSLSGGVGSYTHVIIDHNTFKNIGNNKNGTNFNGTIATRVFQENKTDIDIKNNVFDHCVDGMHLRNNGANSSNWSCTVENNQFLGLPEHYYYASYYNGDNESSNPHLAKFTKNYYVNNDDKVITTNLFSYSSLFKHMASYGEALDEKPVTEAATSLEFYTITYDLDGGIVKSSLPKNYNSVNDKDIELPRLYKKNYIFKGWLLNGNVVNKIPADTRGNLKLKAVFQVESGELYNVTYKYEGGFSEESLMINYNTAPTIVINNYNYNNGSFWGGAYASDIFMGTVDYDPTATFSDRVYIGKNLETGLYEVKGLIYEGQTSEWIDGAEYVITISSSHKAFGSEHSKLQTIKVGDMVVFDKPIDMIDGSNPGNVYFFTEVPKINEITIMHKQSDNLIKPVRLGYEFLGWYDEGGNRVNDLSGLNADITLTAKWK